MPTDFPWLTTLVVVPRLDHFATPKDFRVLDAVLDFLGAGA